MKHQFIFGVLDGQTLDLEVVIADRELRESIPWEDYRKIAEGRDEDGVLQLVKWGSRDYEHEIIEHQDPQNPSITIRPYSTPARRGGYDAVEALQHHLKKPETQVHPSPSFPTSDELPADQQQQRTEAQAKIEAWRAHRDAADSVDRSDEAAVKAYNDKLATLGGGKFLTADSERENLAERTGDPSRVDTQPATSSVSESPTIPGDPLIWKTFEKRRKDIKYPRDRFGTDVGGSKSLGWRLEAGKVSKSDAKKLSLPNVETVYAKANKILEEYELGERAL